MATQSQAMIAVRSRSYNMQRIWKIVSLVVLTVLLIVMLVPFGLITVNSFKTEAEFYDNGPFSLPANVDFDVITGTWERTEYGTKLVNSTIISGSAALIAVSLSLLNAFALGIGKMRGRTYIMLFFLIAIMLPGEALAYPLYYLANATGLYNTRLIVILISAAFHTSFGTYLLTSVLGSFNQELLESAMIDGCNKFQLLLRIVIPLSRPALSVLFVFFFIWTWNDFFTPLIFIISNSKQTVPVAMALARGERNMVVTTQSAAALLGVIPAFVFFVLFQRTLTRGITAGSLK